MGTRGPVGKRTEERAGHRAKADQPERVFVPGRRPKAPAESKTWHQEAKRWYRSLARSGQALYYEPSDWEYARMTAHLLSIELRKTAPSASMVEKILTAMDRLGVTEGARRRMSIEIEHVGATAPSEAPGEDGTVVVMEQFRQLADG